MDNNTIANNFSMLAKLMEIHGENSFKIKSYSNAAFVIEKLPVLSLISPFTNTESCMKQRTVAEETAFLCSSTRRPFKQIF